MAEQKDDLPAEAVTALWQGNKIEAIKMVRQALQIDLKGAKDRVDQYVRTESFRSLARWLFIIALVAIAVYGVASLK